MYEPLKSVQVVPENRLLCHAGNFLLIFLVRLESGSDVKAGDRKCRGAYFVRQAILSRTRDSSRMSNMRIVCFEL